ncbi:REP-associated tyrosine transposase [Ruegeria aquimaris]|uniref:REP-associated tyrosine transposase n=1 Tax=Ruegeria aquimaris TaxID=2984333 RepID=UPI00384BF3DB
MRQGRVDHPLTRLRYGLAMACYIRPQRPGATIFFTVALSRCGGDLLVDQVQLLRDAVSQTRRARPFGIDAWVVLPDHLHAIWTLPEGDADFSTRWGAIKARFSRRCGHRRSARWVQNPPYRGRVGWVFNPPTWQVCDARAVAAKWRRVTPGYGSAGSGSIISGIPPITKRICVIAGSIR